MTRTALGWALLAAWWAPAGLVQGQAVLWLEAEDYTRAEGTVQQIEPATGDYGPMARAEASGQRFLRMAPGSSLTLGPAVVAAAGTRTAWVRAFPMPGRRVTLAVDGVDLGTTPGEADTAVLVWHRIGALPLAPGEHTLGLRAAEGNTGLAYVDAVALLADAGAIPYGNTPDQVLRGEAAPRLAEDFSAESLAALQENWTVLPPPGADALVEMAPGEDDGAIHIHNGAGGPYSLISRRPVQARGGDQISLRLRVRKRTLSEALSVSLAGVGTFAPQLYKHYTDYEYTWLVPPGMAGPVLVRIDGRAGGDTYISRLEVFRPEPPLSSFQTGLFIGRLDNHREGRLFEIERYVVNTEAFSAEADEDGDGLWSLCRLSQAENEPRFSRGTCLKSDSVSRDRDRPEDGCPPLHVRVGPLEPGPFQVYLSAPGRAIAFSRDGAAWQRLPGNAPAFLGRMTVVEPWFEFWLDDRFAEPANPGPAYADFIRFMPVEDPACTMAPAPAPGAPARGSVEVRRVSLTVANRGPSPRVREPVLSGVPVPMGELSAPGHARLLDGSGAEVPCRVTSTGLWPDGSVKWLLLDFQADAAPGETAAFTLEYGNAVAPRPPAAGLSARREGSTLLVQTGPARFLFAPEEGRPFEAFLEGASSPSCSLEGRVAAADGREWALSAARDVAVTLEEESPFRAVVRLRGRFGDAKGAGPVGFDHRVHLFAGRAEALLEYGFLLHAEEETLALRLVRVQLRGPAAGTARFLPSPGKAVEAPAAQGATLLQTGRNPYGNRYGFPFTVTSGAGARLAEGERAAGVLRVEGAGPVLVAVPCFWEQYPKALSCDAGGVCVDLWPDAPGLAPFTAHAGSGKSHRIGVSLLPETSPERWLDPLFAAAGPEWYCGSGAFEGMAPRRAGQYPEYEAVVDAAFEAMMAERAGFGLENWGDVWQEGYVAGARTWSNQEWDWANSWAIPFVRTGDRRYLDYAWEAARHFADVDCIHDHRDPSWVGGSWMHAHTSLVGHQLEPPNFSHAGWVEGMLNVYHLTGDRRGLEASLGIADWIARHAPQREELPASGPPYNLQIQRPAGWPLTTLCLVYRETWRPEYLQTARRIVDYARRCQDPERGAWDAQVGHEVPYRGGCVFAYTLLRGLRLYADLTGEKRAQEDYVRAARWILCELWRPGHRYLYEQCPLHEPGTRVPFLLSEMAGYATRLSGDPLFAALGRDALRFNTAPAQAPAVIAAARRSQWANGILTQAPRLIWDWERTGLEAPPEVTLAPEAAEGTAEVPIERPGSVRVRLRNGSALPLEGLALSCMVRGDWRAEALSWPPRLEAGAEALIELRCQAPPPVMQYALQNDRAHVHLLARYRLGDATCVTWGAVPLRIAQALAVSPGWALAVKPGTSAEVVLEAADGVAARPVFEARAVSDVPGLSVSVSDITAAAPGKARLRVAAAAAPGTAPAAGSVTIEVRSGPRRASVSLDAGIGRFRALMVESPAAGEWRHPFEVLHRYPGIAVEYMPPMDLPRRFPDTAQAIAARWETVILGDTGAGAAAFSTAQLQALADFVLAGGGLMTIGGAKCYTAGGYHRTPLAAVLPVDLTDGSYESGPAPVRVLRPGLRFFEGYEPVFPAFGARQRLQAGAGAEVVAEFGDGMPFMVLGTAGKGRVLCLAAIWNHASGSAFREWREYGRFIGRCVRWTAGDLQAE